MKALTFWFLLGVALFGCKKKEESSAGTLEIAGQRVELPAIVPSKEVQRQANEAEVQQALNEARYNIRYENYATAKTFLNKASAYPNLTASQKDSINKTIEQLNNAMKDSPGTAH